jgi:hypothetical protein
LVHGPTAFHALRGGLREALATGGDIRRLCDLFGHTAGGAKRYVPR